MIAGHLEQHLPWGLGSSLPLVRMGLTKHGGFLGIPQQRGSAPKTRGARKSIVLFRGPAVASLEARTPGFSYVRCPDLWGTQTQCLSFPAREMGLRDMGWGWLEGWNVFCWALWLGFRNKQDLQRLGPYMSDSFFFLCFKS